MNRLAMAVTLALSGAAAAGDGPAEPALKVFIVGHTDSVGNVDANLKLSRDRAESVIQALVTTHGIQSARLRSFGNGPFAPVASNSNDDGRALNRRVELVLLNPK